MTDGTYDLHEGLDDGQRGAVTHGDGPLLILAGPGSGKTRVLCHRTAELIDRGTPPDRVLAVTFTKKAADEMGNRLDEMLGRDAPKSVTTFHSLCARMLKTDGDTIGLEPGWEIANSDTSRRAVRDAIKDLGLPADEWDPAVEQSRISLRKNCEIDPEEPSTIGTKGRLEDDAAREKDSRRIHIRYDELLEEQNQLDFDDLLTTTVLLLEDSYVRAEWSGRWEHILVDEFQDTNTPQYRIMSHLGEHGQITAVGDPDQSIYGWRGAEWSNLTKFKEDFKPEVIALDMNYRSTPNIVEAARGVMESKSAAREAGGEPTSRALKSANAAEPGEKVKLVRHMDERQEADWIHNLGVEAYSRPGTNAANSIAVLYRVNALSRPLEDRLIESGVPYSITAGDRFAGREEVQDAKAYLDLALDSGDDDAFSRIANKPPRGIGPETLKLIATGVPDKPEPEKPPPSGDLFADVSFDRTDSADDTHAPSGGPPMIERAEALLESGEGLNSRQRAGIEKLLSTIDSAARQIADGASAKDVVDGLLDDSGYRTALQESEKPEDATRLENLAQVTDMAGEADRRHAEIQKNPKRAKGQTPPQSAPAMLGASLSKMENTEPANRKSARVHLMTMHAAKGTEFPTVVIIGAEQGLCPLNPRKDDNRQPTNQRQAEERRVFYVGMTRAREQLFLSKADTRNRFGHSEKTKPTPYAADIPPACRTVQMNKAAGRTKISEPIEVEPDPEPRMKQALNRQGGNALAPPGVTHDAAWIFAPAPPKPAEPERSETPGPDSRNEPEKHVVRNPDAGPGGGGAEGHAGTERSEEERDTSRAVAAPTLG